MNFLPTSLPTQRPDASSALWARAPKAAGSAADIATAKTGEDLLAPLEQRLDRLQDRTLDMTQDFLSGVARQLFGADAEGMRFDFDSFSLSTETSVGAAVQTRSGPGGSSAAAALSLQDKASFSGQGTITTADGRTFSFSVEVRYESQVGAAVAASDTSAVSADDLRLGFPGSASDLLRMFGMDGSGEATLPFSLPGLNDGGVKEGARQGSLRMRLLDLLPRLSGQEDSKESSHDMRGRLASAYGLDGGAGLVDQRA